MGNEVKIVVTGENTKGRKVVTDTTKDVRELVAETKKLPERKVIDVKVDDKATGAIKQINNARVDDKELKLTAKDDATAEVDKLSKKKPAPIVVPVRVDAPSDTGLGAGFVGKFRDVGGQAAGALGAGMVAGIAAGGFAESIVGIVGDSIQAASNQKKININLSNQMGISPEDAAKYGTRVGDAYASGLGDSQDQIVQSYSALSSAVKNWSSISTGEQDKIARSAVKVAQAFDIDVNEAVRAASRMVSTGLVPTWEQAFDVITTGMQTLGPSGDDFLETMSEYSGYFKQLGIDGPQALGLIQQGLKSGARDTDFIADAWKEAGIILIDTSDKVRGALKDLGFKNIAKFQDEIAAGGPKAAESVGKVIEALKRIKDPTEKNRLGIEIFGTKWEDTFRRLVDSTDMGAAKLTEFSGATEKLASTTDTEMERMSRRWERGLAVFGEGASGFVNDTVEMIDATTGWVDSMGPVDGLLEAVNKQLNRGKENPLESAMHKVNLAALEMSVTTGQVAPAAFTKMISSMTDAELTAQGATRSIDGTGMAVYRLPGGKIVTVSAVDDASWRIQRAQAVLDNFRSKLVTITINEQRNISTNMVGAPNGWQSAGRNVQGGPVRPAAGGGARSGGTLVNEMGAELGRSQDGTIRDLETGSTVIPAGQSAAIMSGQSPVGPGGGIAVVQLDFINVKDAAGRFLVEALRGAIKTQGGDVQVVLGGKR